jgi:hypothetical protein
MVNAFAPYKRVDLAVEAFNRLGRELLIIGTGQDDARLRRLAGPNVRFLGWTSPEELRRAYAGCRAFVFTAEEDFGITPVEAQACGRPVVALARGGALETVLDGETGVVVADHSVEGFGAGIRRALETRFDPDRLRAHAARFGRERFRHEIASAVDALLRAPTDQVRW